MFDIAELVGRAVSAVLYTVLAVFGAPFLLAAVVANRRARGHLVALPARRPPAPLARAA